jgi:hypothetical protein
MDGPFIMVGIIADLLIFGVIKLFEKASGKPKPDRVELAPHVWQGNTLKPHYNRRFLGAIKNETFLKTSRLMEKTAESYSQIINSLSNVQGLTASSSEFNSLHTVRAKIHKYMQQIDRRVSLRCYQAWKDNNPDSYNSYYTARDKILSLEMRLKEICKNNNIPFKN